MYTLIRTAKLNEIDLQASLADVLACIADPADPSQRLVTLELAASPCDPDRRLTAAFTGGLRYTQPEQSRPAILRVFAMASERSTLQYGVTNGMPNRATVMRWPDAKPEFAARVARVREEQADFVHDQMAEIEDKTLAGEIPSDVARVVISTKQWRVETGPE